MANLPTKPFAGGTNAIQAVVNDLDSKKSSSIESPLLTKTPATTQLMAKVSPTITPAPSVPAPVSSTPAPAPSPSPAPAPAPAPIQKTITKTEVSSDASNPGKTEYFSDGTSTFTPSPKPTVVPPATIQGEMAAPAAPASVPSSPVVPIAPTIATSLPSSEMQIIESDTEATKRQLYANAVQKIKAIQEIGAAQRGTAKGLLAKFGALGTSISGMPVETGLGALSQIKSVTDAAIAEENANLEAAYAAADAKKKTTIQEKVDALNKLNQQNFENAIKAVEAAKAAGNDRYDTVGSNVFDKETGKFIIGPSVGTTDTKNYEYYVEQNKTAGKDSLDFDTWFANEKAPAAVKEYMAAQQNGFTGSIIDYQASKKGVGAAGTGLDADTVSFLASKYLIDNKMPSFGQGTLAAAAKAEFFNAVADQAEAQGLTGPAIVARQAGAKAATSALSKVQQLESTTKAAEESAIKNAEYALKLGETYQRPSDLKKVNSFTKWLAGEVSDKNLTAFEIALFTAAREYAKVASGAAGSVAGLTDSATREAEKLFNPGMTQEQLKAAVATMKQDMENVRGSFETQRQSLEQQIAGGSTSITQPESPTPTNQPTGGYSDKIKQAQDAGYLPKEIVDHLSNDPAVKDKIKAARDAGYTDDQIIQKLSGFNQVGSDTSNANIIPVKIGGKEVSVNKDFGDKLKKASELMFAALGKYPVINQSFRTFAQQKELYDKLSKKGARVAPPGKSFHEKGLAVDVSNWKEAEPYLRKVGLLNNLADDKGHFSLGEFKA